MGRWSPGARARLHRAALELMAEQGYGEATVAAIAERANLTERTFFRYFSDKREVLFAGQDLLADQVLATLSGAPRSLPPLDVVTVGLTAASAFFDGVGRASLRSRQDILDVHPELRGREFVKLADLSGAIERALRERGVSSATAGVAACSGVAVFRVAFASWVAGTTTKTLAEEVNDAVRTLRAVARGA